MPPLSISLMPRLLPSPSGNWCWPVVSPSPLLIHLLENGCHECAHQTYGHPPWDTSPPCRTCYKREIKFSAILPLSPGELSPSTEQIWRWWAPPHRHLCSRAAAASPWWRSTARVQMTPLRLTFVKFIGSTGIVAGSADKHTSSPARARRQLRLMRTSLLWIQTTILHWMFNVQSLELEHDNWI
jgi:hypothetical protein